MLDRCKKNRNDNWFGWFSFFISSSIPISSSFSSFSISFLDDGWWSEEEWDEIWERDGWDFIDFVWIETVA